MRVRIVRKPVERELDGLKLDGFVPGLVVDVTPAIAVWLIAQEYAVVEMRLSTPDDGETAPTRAGIDRRRS